MSLGTGVAEWIWVDGDFKRMRGATPSKPGANSAVWNPVCYIRFTAVYTSSTSEASLLQSDVPLFLPHILPSTETGRTASGMRKPAIIEPGRWCREREVARAEATVRVWFGLVWFGLVWFGLREGDT